MVTPQKEWSSDQPRRHLQRAGTGGYVVWLPSGHDPNSYFVADAAAADFTTKPAELLSFYPGADISNPEADWRRVATVVIQADTVVSGHAEDCKSKLKAVAGGNGSSIPQLRRGARSGESLLWLAPSAWILESESYRDIRCG